MMEKTLKNTRRKNVFVVLATLALAVGVGVSLSPTNEQIKAKAATTHSVTLTRTSFSPLSEPLSGYSQRTFSATGTDGTVFSGAGVITASKEQDNIQFRQTAPAGVWFITKMPGPIVGIEMLQDSAQSGVATRAVAPYFSSTTVVNPDNFSSQTKGEVKDVSASAATTWNISESSNYNYVFFRPNTSNTVYMKYIKVSYSVSDTPPDPDPEFGTLSYITIKTPASKLSFEVGETFSYLGLALTKSDDSEPIITVDVIDEFTTSLDGHVFDEDDVTNSPLTVTIYYQDDSVQQPVTKTYPITITEMVLQDTIISPKTSGNMTGENQASELGLKSNTPLSVFSIKGEASHIGLYANLRLYSIRATGEGNTLKITIAESYVITSITINYSEDTQAASALIKADENTLFNGTDYITNGNSFSPLSAQEFTIKNTTTGGASNFQIRIDSIVITYNYASEIPTLEGLSYTGTPITQYLAGDIFDPTGLEFEAEFSDDTILPVLASLISFTPNPLTVGTTVVVATYNLGSESASVNILGITVIARPTITGISVTKNPNKMTYYKNEAFDKTGMEVTATFSGAPSELITNYIVLPEQFTEAGTTMVTITYNYYGTEKTTTLNVEVIGSALSTDLTIAFEYSGANDSTSAIPESTDIKGIFDGLVSDYLSAATVEIDPGDKDNQSRIYYGGTNNLLESIKPLKFGSGSGKGNVKLVFSDEITITSVTLFVARRTTGAATATMQVNDAPVQNIGVAGASDAVYKQYTFNGAFGHELTIRNNTNIATYLYGIDIEYTTYEEDALAFVNDVMTGEGLGAEGYCSDVLSSLQAKYDGLSEMAQLEFETNTEELFDLARDRMAYLNNWVIANPESEPQSLFESILHSESSTNTLISISVLGLITLIGSYLFIKTKKRFN